MTSIVQWTESNKDDLLSKQYRYGFKMTGVTHHDVPDCPWYGGGLSYIFELDDNAVINDDRLSGWSASR